MAVTVEELQIILSCDASQAEKALGQINGLVDKVSKEIVKSTSKANPKTAKSPGKNSYFNDIVQGIDKASAAQKRFDRAFKKRTDFFSFKSAARGKGFNDYLKDTSKAMDSATKSGDALEDRLKNLPNLTAESQHVDFVPESKPWDREKTAREQAETAAWIERDMNRKGVGKYYIDSEKMLNGTPVEKMRQQMELAMMKADELKQKLDDALNSGSDTNKIYTLGTQLSSASAKADKIAMALGKLKSAEMKGPAKDIELTGNAASNATPKVEAYNRAVSRGRKGGGFFSKAFSHFGKSFHKSHGFLSKFGATLKRVVMRMMAMGLVRGVINGFVQGMKILGNASAEAQKEFGKFTAMGNSVKAALGSVALSVLTALAPLLYSIASAAITAANALARFFAMFGSGSYFAVSMADGFENVESAANGAGGAAKGMLAAFDELNVIGNSGGGGGGGGAGIGNTSLQKMTAESLLADLIKADKFEEAGNLVAENLGIVADKIGAWFDNLSAQHYGAKFAQFLNGIFGNTQAFNKLGSTVAKGCNLIINTLYDFVSTFDAAQAAKSLASGLNTAISEIEWDKLGATLGLGLLDALEFVVNFVKDINWGQLIKSITDMAFNAIKAILSNPQRLVRLIKDLVLGVIDVLGGLVFGGIGGIIEGLSTFFPALKGVGDQIAQGWDDTMNELDQILDEQIDKMSTTWGELGDASEETADRAVTALEEQETQVDALTEAHRKLNQVIGDNPYNTTTEPKPITNQKLFNKEVQFGESAYGLLSKANRLFVQDDKMPVARDTMNGYGTAAERAGQNVDGLNRNVSNMDPTTKPNKGITAFDQFGDIVATASTKVGNLSSKISSMPSERTTTLKVNVNATVKATSGGSGTTVTKPNFTVNMQLANGGIAYGNTLAQIGEYPGAKFNPEVVAPLSDLTKILEKSGGGGKASEQSMKEQNELLRQQNSLLTSLLNKELTISPSPALGQVISQSSAMFARA